MKSYRALAIKELFAQRVTSVLVLIAVILSTMMTTIVGQSLGVLTAMREQQAIALGGNRYATFLQMDADQLHASTILKSHYLCLYLFQAFPVRLLLQLRKQKPFLWR